jgi:hypothetical protein
MAGDGSGLDERPDERADAASEGAKGAGTGPARGAGSGPGRGGRTGPGRGSGPGRGGPGQSTGTGGRKPGAGSRPPGPPGGGAGKAGKAGKAAGAAGGAARSAGNAAGGQSGRALQAAGKLAGRGARQAGRAGSSAEEGEQGEQPGVGARAGKAAARAGTAVATRAAAAAATGGASLAVELKMILITIGVFVVLIIGVLLLLMTLGGMSASGDDSTTGGVIACAASPEGRREIPQNLMPIYESAAAQTDPQHPKPLGDRGVWILAAINSIESDFGNNMGPSSAGAIGWMQFMPATWEGYGVDADGDGRKDPYDPDDAIHAAAALLRANGAPENWYRAIWGYNHLDSYVRDVESLADVYQGSCEIEGGVGLGDLSFNDTSGPWGGSMKFAKALANLGRQFGCVSVSEKRETQNTASGGVSDHWVGSTDAYAVDLAGPNCSLDHPDGGAAQTARAIGQALGMPWHGDCHNLVKGSYRFQLIWHTDCGGNHYDHVHIGVRLMAASADDID